MCSIGHLLFGNKTRHVVRIENVLLRDARVELRVTLRSIVERYDLHVDGIRNLDLSRGGERARERESERERERERERARVQARERERESV